jgi:hypothetical protein
VTGLTAAKMDWTAVYDTNRLVDGADLSSPLFVDVAGLHGMDTMRLLAKHPSLPSGVLFVQDLPEVVEVQTGLDEQAVAAGKPRLDSRIARMNHDFYQPQPLPGARAYFLHTVLHDWPDSNCVRICKLHFFTTRYSTPTPDIRPFFPPPSFLYLLPRRQR